MNGDGHSPAVCLDFDIALLQFDGWVETRKNEMKRVSAPPGPRHPTQMVPKHETLADLLDLDSEAEIAANTPDFEAKADAMSRGEIDLESFGMDPDPDEFDDEAPSEDPDDPPDGR